MYQYQHKVSGQIIDAVPWDGVGLPQDCPAWLRAFDGHPLHVDGSMQQSGPFLFINTAEQVMRAEPGVYIAKSEDGFAHLIDPETLGQNFNKVPDPEPEELTEPGDPE
jgi:hypothetical protein